MSQIDNRTKQPPQSADAEDSQRDSLLPIYDNVFRKFHHHTLSDSTNTLGSNDSSPTTTISTVDDSSATEPSPGSSPESPPPTTFAVGMLRPRTAHDRSTPFFELQKQPPPRKGRNLKGLAVNTTRQTATAKGASASTTSLPLRIQTEDSSTILSPSFVKPPTPSTRRKPSNLGLTILTPGGAKPPPQLVRLTIPGAPPTPGFQRPTLRHFQSSPSLPLVPGLGVQSNRSYQQQQALETIFSPVELKSSPQIDEEEEEEQNFDIPLSREEKPEAYPDGPICVYDPRIDLYLEPTAEQARQYDVIMNVASEVRNPFVIHHEPVPAEPDLRLDGGGGIQYAPKRDRLGVQASDAGEASPTTPKATPMEPNFPPAVQVIPTLAKDARTKEPEYIHIPWEHNSDIVPDLFRLVKVIDEKVNEGKSILVHCQCGVSRSASLVVAYGIYKNPAMSVQEAYDAVKKRSKWIGPNMNLIMQLQEFRSSLSRGGILGDRTLSPLTPGSAMSDWKGPFSSSNPTPLTIRNGPLSAVVAPANRAATDEMTAITPGPASAPLAPWAVNGKGVSSRNRAVSAVKPATAYVDPSGHVVVPVLKVIASDSVYAQIPPIKASSEESVPETAVHSTPETVVDLTPSSPRSAHFAMIPLQPPEEVDAADSFGIMSPTSTEFSSSPFDRSSLLASLGMGSMRADEETPRRSLSLRNRAHSQAASNQQKQDLQPVLVEGQLRGKISSPSLREQRQLQTLQAKIEATLPARQSPQAEFSDMDALMSPRATEFTDNPFALSVPTATTSTGGTPSAVDPRSPAMKGANPITRSILDVL